MPTPLWTPSAEQIADTHLEKFSCHVATQTGQPDLMRYQDLHRFSLDQPEDFWRYFITYAELEHVEWGAIYSETVNAQPALPMYRQRFFPRAQLNLAQLLMPRDNQTTAIRFFAEGYTQSQLSWRQLHHQVSRLQQALKKAGLQVGDRVCAITPNTPEAVITMLATLSLGGVYSSCSPDFGSEGIIERFAQIKPKFLLCADGYWYQGKAINIDAKIHQAALAMRNDLESIIRYRLVDHQQKSRASFPPIDGVPCYDWVDFLADFTPLKVQYTLLGFDHPAFILFSSGTTGKPKCFIHAQGHFALSNRVDLLLHNDVRCHDKVMFFTTCGWMMWNWLIGALGIGATVVLYDGSPLAHGPKTLFHLAEQENLALLGLSPKLLSIAEQQGYCPKKHYALAHLRRIATTGSPLGVNNFSYVYQNIKADMHLAPISGGTDILGCFLGGEPRAPVYAGQMQVPLLGKDVVVMDDHGAVCTQGTGELVCRQAFIGMPVGLWDDPEDTGYYQAYFARFAASHPTGVWCHGDYLEQCPNGYIIHGRSDTVLNPSGVRIGTAEIYGVTDTLETLQDAVVVGQQWQGDVRVVLFVVLADGVVLDEDLCRHIRTQIRQRCSPRHVPALILAVPAVPRTRSGKISEKAVIDTIHGLTVSNQQALANPEALAYFADHAALSQPTP